MNITVEHAERSLNSVYIVVDTSFILKDILVRRHLDSEALIERCMYIRSVSGKSLRLPEGVEREMKKSLCEYMYDKNVRNSINIFRRKHHFPAIPNTEELYYYDFFKSQIERVGKQLNKDSETRDLSPIDMHIGAYSILKTIKGEVILCTQDDLLMTTVRKVYDVAHSVFAERKKSNRLLYIARTPVDIESTLDAIGRLKGKRRLELELLHQAKEFGFENCSPS